MAKKESSDKIVDIKTLQNEVNDKIMKQFNHDLLQVNQDLANKLEQANAKIKHLENLLTKHVPVIGNSQRLITSDEQTITEMQLQFLKEKALTRELTLDEIKKYDLLIKNKRLSEGQSTVNTEYKTLPTDVSSSDLVQIASQTIEEDSSDGEKE